MHADELRTAVAKIVKLLNHAGIRQAVDQYRASKGDQREAAAARLGHAGAILVEHIDGMSPNERQVVKCLHLESLGSAEYWQQLTAENSDPKAQHTEIVRLASRVMFSSSHLPAIVSLLEGVPTGAAVAQAAPEANGYNSLSIPLEQGEGFLLIRLTDAGERASDPDRVARAIDGVDMLYSACASIARKPAIDLRLDNVLARENRDRDFRFTGDRDSVSAVYAVIDSIPAALAEIDPEQDIDLDAVVHSLPIFQDLSTLASLGTFSGKDLKDISETMHQGALLTLESGVILIDEDNDPHFTGGGGPHPGTQSAAGGASANMASESSTTAQASPSAAESDEHYNRYLREREAMMTRSAPELGNTGAINGHSPSGGLSGVFARAEDGTDDKTRKDAVNELLNSLGQSRSS